MVSWFSIWMVIGNASEGNISCFTRRKIFFTVLYKFQPAQLSLCGAVLENGRNGIGDLSKWVLLILGESFNWICHTKYALLFVSPSVYLLYVCVCVGFPFLL